MSSELTAPAAGYAAVTASDSTDLGPVRALYVGGAGSLVLSTGLTGSGVTFANVPVGILPCACRRVMAASTATSVVALY